MGRLVPDRLLLNAVNHDHLDGSLRGLQLETKLILNRLEDRRSR